MQLAHKHMYITPNCLKQDIEFWKNDPIGFIVLCLGYGNDRFFKLTFQHSALLCDFSWMGYGVFFSNRSVLNRVRFLYLWRHNPILNQVEYHPHPFPQNPVIPASVSPVLLQLVTSELKIDCKTLPTLILREHSETIKCAFRVSLPRITPRFSIYPLLILSLHRSFSRKRFAVLSKFKIKCKDYFAV